MADTQYPYPPDRFDDEADAATFHGAHRAEEPFWRQNLIYLVIIAAAFVTLLVLLFLIGGMGRDGDDRASDPTSPAASETTEEAPAEEEGAEGEEEAPAPEPDRSIPVMVINAGGINGMAGAWRDSLEGSGWEQVSIGTADNVQQEPVVFYRDEADAETAQALAQEVGAGEARQSDEYESRITFVAVTEPGSGGQEGEGGNDG
ncbi:LytR C-terminal domain-containing protein [Brachybacterium sp. p3-SID1565]|uniref:LytR C-terminal domain-containing protein n=1 Tax=Brachybacterium epidermidis TaxID=2781983 RepID=A0ABR9W2X2_9MICO|nr:MULTISPECIES: LytR C-terminal domain-containing protein [unclassified Brachybacterium]MBE9404795.1 LytR C-terminal domain-containing protein [Brachybacterium epidermidis]MCT1384997.1 LytR C-terminal domain-containing protein [Brachybacterium sp. p3-SID1565]MCT1775305.1 LytR C-terminal domain-containing protein [Brachybacterium sp. p3-SID957]